MRTVRIAYWQEQDGMWLGHLESYPDHMTQGDTLEELKENLKDILRDIESKHIPMVRTHEDRKAEWLCGLRKNLSSALRLTQSIALNI